MSDPAVEAAQRTWPWGPAHSTRIPPFVIAESAAREMAKPIRELLADWDFCYEAQETKLLKALEPLIFTTEEIEAMNGGI